MAKVDHEIRGCPEHGAPDQAAVQRLLAIPLTDAERDDTRALVRWFTRRYPTPAERFAYIRRARARWSGSAPRQP
jgi:hypothetical protein